MKKYKFITKYFLKFIFCFVIYLTSSLYAQTSSDPFSNEIIVKFQAKPKQIHFLKDKEKLSTGNSSIDSTFNRYRFKRYRQLFS